MLHLKRTVPLAIAFLSGILLLIQYFVPHPWSAKFLQYTSDWQVTLAYAALLLGVGSLVQSHVTKARRKAPGWGFSAVALAAFGITVAMGMWWSVHTAWQNRTDASIVTTGSGEGSPLSWVYNSLLFPMGGAMFSILGFFIASAAFRAFRVKSPEATLLLLSAIVVMLGQVPLGAHLPGIPQLSAWLLSVPTTAAKRAIGFGVALGSIATALRVIFGIERAYLGGE